MVVSSAPYSEHLDYELLNKYFLIVRINDKREARRMLGFSLLSLPGPLMLKEGENEKPI